MREGGRYGKEGDMKLPFLFHTTLSPSSLLVISPREREQRKVRKKEGEKTEGKTTLHYITIVLYIMHSSPST